jgi:hypothetical protein
MPPRTLFSMHSDTQEKQIVGCGFLHNVNDFSKLFFFFLAILGFELRASHLLGRHCITWATPLALFALVIGDRLLFFFLPWLVWIPTSYFTLPTVAGNDRCTTMPRFSSIEVGSHEWFCLEPWSSWSQLLNLPGETGVITVPSYWLRWGVAQADLEQRSSSSQPPK